MNKKKQQSRQQQPPKRKPEIPDPDYPLVEGTPGLEIRTITNGRP